MHVCRQPMGSCRLLFGALIWEVLRVLRGWSSGEPAPGYVRLELPDIYQLQAQTLREKLKKSRWERGRISI